MEVKHLLVKIGANKEDYEGAMGGVASSLQAHKEQFHKVGMAMTAVGGAIVGSIGLMVKGYVNAGDEVHKMALRTGISTTALSEFRYAADICGTTLETVEKGIKKMSATIFDAKSGLAESKKAFDMLKIPIDDLIKMKPEDQFLTIARAIADIENPTIRAALAQDIFGRAGTQLLPLFAEGAAGLDALRQKAHELGIVFDEEAAAKAAKLKDAQTALKASFQGVFFAIADTVVPALTSFAGKITDIITKVKDWIKEHPKLAEWVTKIALGIGALLTVLGPLVMMLPALAAGFTLLWGPIGIVVAAIAGLTAAGILVVANWGKIKTFLTNVWNSIKEVAVNVFNSIKQFFIDSLMWILDKVSKIPIAGKFAEGWKKSLESIRAEMGVTKTVVTERGLEMARAFVEAAGKSDLFKKAAGFLKDKVGDLGKIFKVTKKDSGDLGDAFDEIKEKARTWVDYLKDVGIMTIKQKGEKVKELEGFLRDIERAYKDGKISVEDYTEAKKKLRAEIEAITTKMTETALPAARDFGDAILVAAGKMDTHTFATQNAKEQLIAFAREVGWTTEQVQRNFYLLIQSMMSLSGFHIPNVSLSWKEAWPQIVEGAENVRTKWDEMADGIKTKWINELSSCLQGAQSFKDSLKGVWGTIKSQFFDLVAEMITKWTLGLVSSILSGGKGLLSGITGIFGDIGKAATGTEGGTGTGGLFGGLSGSFLSSIAKIAGPLGIGLLVAKFVDLKAVGQAVTGALCTAIDAIGGVIKSVGKVFESIFGAGANIIAGIGNVIGALGNAISSLGGLIGAGGKKYEEITYWLKDIRQFVGETRDRCTNIRDDIKYSVKLWEKTMDAQFVTRDKLFQVISALNPLGAIKDWTKEVVQNLNKVIGSLADMKYLKEIAKNTGDMVKALKSVTGGQYGVHEITRKSTLYMAHPNEEVRITPLKALPAASLDIRREAKQSIFNKFNIYGPLISTVGLSNADLEYASDSLMRMIERKLTARGKSF